MIVAFDSASLRLLLILALIEQYKDADTLTAEMVDAFIDEMILYNNGHVEVKFNFRNELDEVIHLAAIRQREVERYAM